jgi:hypothetical protein
MTADMTADMAKAPLLTQAVRKRFSSPKRLHGTGAIHVDATV